MLNAYRNPSRSFFIRLSACSLLFYIPNEQGQFFVTIFEHQNNVSQCVKLIIMDCVHVKNAHMVNMTYTFSLHFFLWVTVRQPTVYIALYVCWPSAFMRLELTSLILKAKVLVDNPYTLHFLTPSTHC